ncbi:MAG: UrcA family protein [Alphaproteobacteria bacterium]
MRSHAFMLATIFIFGAAAPTFAETTPAARAVSYSDLDLTQAADARTMLTRLDRAARFACGGDARFDENYRIAPNAVAAEFELCRADALNSAVSQLNAPTVSRLYADAQGADTARGR